MTTTIAVAGATGNLGTRIVKALLARKVNVIALVRTETPSEKIHEVEGLGATTALVNMTDKSDYSRALAGVACIVSAMQGLREVIIDTQTALLDAGMASGVARFIPSDFSADFTHLPAGENRNFDLRRAFHERLDAAPIAATSIFNGAFAEMLSYAMPLLDFDQRTVGYWEDPERRLDFTTMDDTAAFTAAAACDASTPRALHIASFQVSPSELVKATAEVFKTPFALRRLGSFEDLRQQGKRERAAHPEGENELYPSWQQMQYLQSMFSTLPHGLDNNRYSDVAWTPLSDILNQIAASKARKDNV